MKKLMIFAMAAIGLAACGNKENKNEKVMENIQDTVKTAETINPEEYRTTNEAGMQEVCDFVKACGYYMLATVEGDQPRVRPFGTINIYEGKLYIQTGHKKKVAQQLDANGKTEICAYNAEKGTWIRISGVLVDDPRVEAKHDMLEHYPELRDMYDENDGNTAVYFFTDGVATISSFTEPAKEILF